MRAVRASLLALLLIVGVVAPAAAADGNDYFLNNSLEGGNADLEFSYGRDDDQVLVGDWDGNGTDTLGVRRGATYYLSNTFKGGNADRTFTYGRTNDEVFVGDWNGDGKDTLAVRRGRTFYVSNELRGGDADAVFDYGRLGDIVLVGDWDGDGDDTFGVRRGATYFLNNRLRGGNADNTFTYGRSGDLVYVGDWDGRRGDTLGVRRGATYYLNNTLRGGNADVVFTYGRTGDTTLVGDWDGDGDHTLGVRRSTPEAPAADVWTVTNIIDGDTADVQRGSRTERVRVIGIDTPERGECGYSAASSALAAMVLNEQVVLTAGARDDRDRYGRILRYIDIGRTDAGLSLIKQGLAIARYDSRDGYGWHPREATYIAADAATSHRCAGAEPEPPSSGPGTGPDGTWKNCTEAREAGATPVYRGDPGYGPHLDRDNDGIGCE